MRLLLISTAAMLALSGPALAQEPAPAPAGAPASDTLQAITTHGMVITAGGQDIDVAFAADGKFTALDGQVTGTWRTDGDKLCTTSNVQPDETCVVYPTGKKSGDSFDVTGDQGSATIKIK